MENVQVPGWFVHHQHQQSTEKLIAGDGCSYTPALILVPPAQAMRHRYGDQRKNTTILTMSLKSTQGQSELKESPPCGLPLGQECGMRQGDSTGTMSPFPPSTPGSISALSSQLQSLNQQIITLTLQMFNFLLQLHRFCSRKGGSGEQMKTSWVFPNKPRAALIPSGCPLHSPDRDGGQCSHW